MKKIPFLLLLAALSTGALAQDKKEYSKVSKSVSDDGKTLDIKVTLKAKGEKTQRYEQTFSIENMSKAEKEALVNRIMDSLGVPNNPPPKAPEPPKPPKQKKYAGLAPGRPQTLYTRSYA